ncbi:hypothetical protein ACFSRY_03385 [Pontibacter locisalis]|uniref:Uncharacterized protein n=1 Tax=Pontibacter locisalis TaxID=1719035 RepID=A0ABW5IGW4_9BACT
MNNKGTNKPLKETTKDDSSDVEKVKKHKSSPPPQPDTKNDSREAQEDEDAQKGHS